MTHTDENNLPTGAKPNHSQNDGIVHRSQRNLRILEGLPNRSSPLKCWKIGMRMKGLINLLFTVSGFLLCINGRYLIISIIIMLLLIRIN